MKTASDVVFAIRALFMDAMTYVVPGGFFVLVIVASVKWFVKGANPLQPLADLSVAVGENWSATFALITVGILAYATGMVLRVCDELLEAKVPRFATRGLRLKGCDFAVRALGCELVKRWGEKAKETRVLYRLSESMLLLVDTATSQTLERYYALQNFCGALSLAVPLSAVASVGVAIFSCVHGTATVSLLQCCWLTAAALLLGGILFFILQAGKLDFARLRSEMVCDTCLYLLRPSALPQFRGRSGQDGADSPTGKGDPEHPRGNG
ncbi:MAG: hypothetical protein ACYTFZ_08630, partial [Planctomycetota bacterium]